MINEDWAKEWLEKRRLENKKNKYFESMVDSIKKRSDADNEGRYFRISERYLNLDADGKKKLVNANIIYFRFKKDRMEQRTRKMVYAMIDFIRKNNLRIIDIPAQICHEVKYE